MFIKTETLIYRRTKTRTNLMVNLTKVLILLNMIALRHVIYKVIILLNQYPMVLWPLLFILFAKWVKLSSKIKVVMWEMKPSLYIDYNFKSDVLWLIILLIRSSDTLLFHRNHITSVQCWISCKIREIISCETRTGYSS